MEDPQPPGRETPEKVFDTELDRLVGLGSREVKRRLGSADHKSEFPHPPRTGDELGYHGPSVSEALPSRKPCSLWTYTNVEGRNWVLWLAEDPEYPAPPPEVEPEAPKRGFLDRFLDWCWRGPPAGSELRSRRRLGRLKVYGVTSYPTGARF